MANDGPYQRKNASAATTTGRREEKPFVPTDEAKERDRAADTHSHWEFGGPPGVTAMMLGFPALVSSLLDRCWDQS
jgi:hypothetical protein